MPDPAPLQPIRRDHLATLMAAGPIAQHARGIVPDPAHGSCTDDVARALQVDLLHGPVLGWDVVMPSLRSGLRYLDDAIDESSGRVRNFRAADGRWLETIGSEDSHGRTVLALGEAVGTGPDRVVRDRAAGTLQRTLAGVDGLTALRAQASAFIGCETARRAGMGGELAAVQHRLGERIARRFEPVAWSMDWPWPEPVLTYETALPSRALILAGRRMGDRRVTEMGLAVLEWLVRTATAPAGHLSPVGNGGWWPQGGVRPRFDQQPIEATALLLAAEAAFDATGDPGHVLDMERAYAWFLGANDLGLLVADPPRGGCHDGLRADGLNDNQGAESTLAWLTALERIRIIRRRLPALEA